MEIEFKLQEADLVTLAKYQMEHSPAIVRRYRLQRYSLLAIFGLLAVVSYFILNKPAVAFYAAALAIFCFSLYPFYYRWVAGRTLRRIVDARLNPSVFASRKLQLGAEGLRQITNSKEILIPWSRIGAVTMTSGHAFIAIDDVYGFVIPRGQVQEDRLQRFVEALRAGRFDKAGAES